VQCPISDIGVIASGSGVRSRSREGTNARAARLVTLVECVGVLRVGVVGQLRLVVSARWGGRVVGCWRS